jgi:hypothetical protein
MKLALPLISLAVVALAFSSVRFSGSSQPTPQHTPPPAPTAQR